MDIPKNCPICKSKLYSKNISNKIEKTCNAPNHLLTFTTSNNKIEYLKISLDSRYSKIIEIDFIKNSSKITSFINKQNYIFNVPKIIEPDFPNLQLLKEKVDLYISMS